MRDKLALVRHTLYFQETLNKTATDRITEQQDMVTVPVLTVMSPSGPVSASLTVTTSSTVAVWVSLTQV